MDPWEDKPFLINQIDQTPDTWNESGSIPSHNVVATEVQTPARKKTSSRVLFTLLSVGMLVVLVVSFIALGSFGKKQREITNFQKGTENTSLTCILYSKYVSQTPDDKIQVLLQKSGVCAFVLWGLVSVSIGVLSSVIYLVSLAILGTKIFSPLRILDLVLSFSVFFISFVISITITAGINETCRAASDHVGRPCFFLERGNGDEKVSFYDAMTVAKNSSWAVTVFLLLKTIWNVFMVIIYCLQKHSRNQQETTVI